MSLRRATMLVARREFGERIRQRAFQISTLVTVLIVAAIALAAGLLGDDGPQDFKVGAQGAEAVAIATAAQASARPFDIRIELRRFANAAEARAAAKAEDVDAAIVGDQIVSKDSPPLELEQVLQAAAREVRAGEILRRAGLQAADARRALAPPALDVRSLGAGDEESRKGVAFVASLLLYMQLIIFGLAVASGVVEEKSSRVVEVLLAAVPARALLAGKILGIGVLGLMQLALTAVVGLGVAAASGAIELGSADAGVLAVVLLWFLLGYLFYSAIYAISGVIVSRQEDLQSSSTPVTMVLVAGYLVAFPVLEDPGSSLAVISSMVPFTAPIVMPVRVAVGEASGVEIAASLGVLVLAIGAARAARRAHLRGRCAADGQAAEDPRGAARRAGVALTGQRRQRRAASPRSRNARVSTISSDVGPLCFGPGVSSTSGRPSKRGSERNAAQPSSPSSPAPTFAWRSTFEPSGVCESLRCSEPRRSMPTCAAQSSSTALSASALRIS